VVAGRCWWVGPRGGRPFAKLRRGAEPVVSPVGHQAKLLVAARVARVGALQVSRENSETLAGESDTSQALPARGLRLRLVAIPSNPAGRLYEFVLRARPAVQKSEPGRSAVTTTAWTCNSRGKTLAGTRSGRVARRVVGSRPHTDEHDASHRRTGSCEGIGCQDSGHPGLCTRASFVGAARCGAAYRCPSESFARRVESRAPHVPFQPTQVRSPATTAPFRRV
jgi:hypothetical protein